MRAERPSFPARPCDRLETLLVGAIFLLLGFKHLKAVARLSMSSAAQLLFLVTYTRELSSMGILTQTQIEYMVAHVHEDRRYGYIIANAIMLFAAFVAFVSRFVSRRLGSVKLGVDDLFMLIGMVSLNSLVPKSRC